MINREFGPYQLVRQIAVGGMAEIFLAKTSGIAGFEKYVALKMIHPNLSQDKQFIQMLIDEAKLSVQLQHSNIAQTFDLGRVDDTYYITMEFVDGADLYKLLRTGAEADLDVPIPVCAYVAKEVLIGLDYAHRRKDMQGRPLGIVHRDISPQNVLVSESGEVKVVDFGIAKATLRAQQTQAGVIKGKYFYMSPEQAHGHYLDHRTDIFSAGILLYEMITGQMLYLEEDMHRLIDMVRKADIAPPTTLRPDCPLHLEKIVMRALQKLPENRYQTANRFAADLERFLHASAPIFTSNKISSWFSSVIGDRQTPYATSGFADIDTAEKKPRKRGVIREQIAVTREDFEDENSIIFDLQEDPRRSGGFVNSPLNETMLTRDPDELTPADTLYSDEDPFESSDENTVISDSPGFMKAPMQSEAFADTFGASNFSDDTSVDDDTDDESARPPLGSFKSRAPVFEAFNPSSNISELRKPKESRKTPAQGVHLPRVNRPPVSKASLSDLLGKLKDGGEVEMARSPEIENFNAGNRELFDSAPTSLDERRESTNQRLNNLEVDAIPEAFKITKSKSGWWIWPLIFIGAVLIGVGATYLWQNHAPEQKLSTTDIAIHSSPAGAIVRVDSVELDSKTPALFDAAEFKKTYLISIDLEGHEVWEKEFLVKEPQPKIIARLQRLKVRLKISSDPSDAEVFIGGQSKGRTPLSIDDLYPEQAEAVELRKKGYRPVTRKLDWSEQSENQVHLELKR